MMEATLRGATTIPTFDSLLRPPGPGNGPVAPDRLQNGLAKSEVLDDNVPTTMPGNLGLETPPTRFELEQFSKQFSREQWQILCQNRGFVHFLADDLAACRLLAKKVLERHGKPLGPVND